MDKFDVEMNDIGDPLICKLSESKFYLMNVSLTMLPYNPVIIKRSLLSFSDQ